MPRVTHPQPVPEPRPAQDGSGAEAQGETDSEAALPPAEPALGLEISADGQTVRARRDGVEAVATFGGDLPAGRCHRLSLALLPREGLGRVDIGP
jgi:hypothetical protein